MNFFYYYLIGFSISTLVWANVETLLEGTVNVAIYQRSTHLTPRDLSTYGQSRMCKSRKPEHAQEHGHKKKSNHITKHSDPTSTDQLNSFQSQVLNLHNQARKQYNAPPLQWSTHLESEAQKWSDACVYQHGGLSQSGKGGEGQNIAVGYSNFKQVMQGFMDEASQYDPNDPQPSHFTQCVWKATTHVACTVTSCDSINFDGGNHKAPFYVCNYSPAGNVVGNGGSYFRANVDFSGH